MSRAFRCNYIQSTLLCCCEITRLDTVTPAQSRAHLESSDAGARDELTVVELDAMQVLAAHQVLERRVGDERTVVELERDERFSGALRAAQVTYAFVRDQFTV